jgi:transcription elongation factor Elf1
MKINNCPFCKEPKDSNDVLDIGRLAFCVHCAKCKCYGPNAESQEMAIAKWNEETENEKLIGRKTTNNPR